MSIDRTLTNFSYQLHTKRFYRSVWFIFFRFIGKRLFWGNVKRRMLVPTYRNSKVNIFNVICIWFDEIPNNVTYNELKFQEVDRWKTIYDISLEFHHWNVDLFAIYWNIRMLDWEMVYNDFTRLHSPTWINTWNRRYTDLRESFLKTISIERENQLAIGIVSFLSLVANG